MPNKPGELARVVRLVGIEHKINITGMVVPPTDGGLESIAVMHLQTLNPGPVIDALTCHVGTNPAANHLMPNAEVTLRRFWASPARAYLAGYLDTRGSCKP